MASSVAEVLMRITTDAREGCESWEFAETVAAAAAVAAVSRIVAYLGQSEAVFDDRFLDIHHSLMPPTEKGHYFEKEKTTTEKTCEDCSTKEQERQC